MATAWLPLRYEKSVQLLVIAALTNPIGKAQTKAPSSIGQNRRFHYSGWPKRPARPLLRSLRHLGLSAASKRAERVGLERAVGSVTSSPTRWRGPDSAVRAASSPANLAHQQISVCGCYPF